MYPLFVANKQECQVVYTVRLISQMTSMYLLFFYVECLLSVPKEVGQRFQSFLTCGQKYTVTYTHDGTFSALKLRNINSNDL